MNAPVVGAAGPVARSEEVVLLDEDGVAIGTAPKAAVHHTATPLHLAFSCYVFDGDGNLLATRRAVGKATFPGVRTNSCCGHPAPGEPPADAVRRRVRQELGLEVGAVELLLPRFRYRAVAADGVVENEICPVFRALVTHPRPDPRPNPDEVERAWWLPWARWVAGGQDLADPPSVWAAEQLPQLVALGPDPLAWPAADPAQLPPAAR